MEKFNVIIDDINRQEFVAYDVIPYFIEEYNKVKKKDRPTTFEEFREFVKSNSMYRFWSRCEYEIILKALVSKTKDTKIDIHWQIMNNLDLVTRLVMNELKIK